MLKLNDLFTDNCVLQAEEICLLSGKTESYNRVVVTLNETVIKIQSNKDGEFVVELPAQKYGYSTNLLVETSTEKQTVKVQYGDVFLFGGQSNMEYKMKDEIHFTEEQENVCSHLYFNNVPIMDYDSGSAQFPDKNTNFSWQLLTSDNLQELSAIAYYSLKEYQLQHPDTILGVVVCSKGGTSAVSWIDKKSFNDDELRNNLLIPYENEIENKTIEESDREFFDFMNRISSHLKKRETYQRKHPEMSVGEVKKIVGAIPWPPPMSKYIFTRPNGLFENAFLKVAPFSYHAVVWYQGEEDTEHGNLYEKLLSNLITQWRERLISSVPFYLVQLPICEDKPNHDWPAVREAQRKIAEETNSVFLITSLDCGEIDNIHPKEKRVLGQRVGKTLNGVPYQTAPVAKLVSWQGNKIEIVVKNADEFIGLSKEVFESDEEIKSVTTHENEIWIETDSEIDEVSYAWHNVPQKIFYNEAGYPVSPFKFKNTITGGN